MKYKRNEQLPNGEIIDQPEQYSGGNEPNEIINDYLIQPKDSETGMRHKGRHFQIEYSIPDDAYFIKDLGVGQGAFVRIDTPLDLKDNHLINIGNSFMIVNLIQGNKQSMNNSVSTYDGSAGRGDKENHNPQYLNI
jgi:hypothetical protein